MRKEFIYKLKNELPYLQLDNKEFKWHLTLGRVKAHAQRDIDISKCLFDDIDISPTLEINQIALYQSILSSSGPIYKNLARFNLSNF